MAYTIDAIFKRHIN